MTVTSAVELFAPVRAGLAAVEAHLRETVAGQHSFLTAATEHLLRAGGKRIRPAVCLLTAGIFAADRAKSVSLATAVEMLHTATLVHDDLIDGAPLRRGVPTLNASLSPNSVILTGDYLFARAAHFGTRTGNLEVMNLFAQTVMTIVNGEIKQVLSRCGVGRDGYYERICAKTAAMFVLATEAAATLGGADKAGLDASREYGHNLGMAYQIVDDVLDFIGSPEHMGKPAGNDLCQGLVTLPAIYYFEAHPDDPDVQAFLSKQTENRDAVSEIVAAIRRSDAIAKAMQKGREFSARAQLALEKLPDSVYVTALSNLASYIVNRNL